MYMAGVTPPTVPMVVADWRSGLFGSVQGQYLTHISMISTAALFGA